MKKLLGIMGFLAISASAFAGLFDMYVVDGDKAYSVATYGATPGEYRTELSATIGKYVTQDIYIYDSAEDKAIDVAAYAGAGATDIVVYMAIGTDVKSSIAQGVKVYNADLTLGDYVPGLEASQYLTFTKNERALETVSSPGGEAYSYTFEFNVASNIPDYLSISFQLTSVDVNGKEIWESSFTLMSHAPSLDFGSYTIDDTGGNNNGRIDPGETVDITIEALNNGHSLSPSSSASDEGSVFSTVSSEELTGSFFIQDGIFLASTTVACSDVPYFVIIFLPL